MGDLKKPKAVAVDGSRGLDDRLGGAINLEAKPPQDRNQPETAIAAAFRAARERPAR